MACGGWCLSPAVNLITNIGVQQSTHDMTSVADLTEQSACELPEKLVFPRERNVAAAGFEREASRKINMPLPLWKRASVKIRKAARKLLP